MLRLPTRILSISILSIGLLLTLDAATAVAQHKGRHPKSSRSSRRVSHKSHSLRGDPNVTRRVAKLELLEKLPELAALVGIDTQSDPDLTGYDKQIGQPTLSDDSVMFAAMTSVMEADAATERKIGQKGYNDSEVDETELPDVASEVDADLEDLPQEDMTEFRTEFEKYMASLNGSKLGAMVTDNGIDKQTMMEALVSWLGTRYHFGGMGRNGIDCSAFTGTMYRSQNVRLPRTAAAQWDAGMKIEPHELQFGDLVFFHTRQSVYVSHVGMYLGNGMFSHASSRNGVTVSALGASYYSSHFIGARRFTAGPSSATAVAQYNPESTQN